MRDTRTPADSQLGCGRPWRGEAGSILVPVAVALLGLLSFSAFTIDNGIMLSSRRAAQNAADAGAMAAGLYLAWDDDTDQPGAQASGVAAAQLHQVWDNQPDITLADVTFPTCPPGAPGPVDNCVRVDVFRNQRANGNPLPAFFASLAGVADQGVKATATAQIVYGAGANCLLPFAIPDRWKELREDWTVDPPAPPGDAVDDSLVVASYPYDDFQNGRYDTDGDFYDVVEVVGQGSGPPLTGIVDIYVQGPGPMVPDLLDPLEPTGYSPDVDHGTQVEVKEELGERITPSWMYPVVLPDGLGPGGNNFGYRILNCTDTKVPLDHVFQVEPGVMVGPMNNLDTLIAQDPDAVWNDALTTNGHNGAVDGGCSAIPPTGAPACGRSPRLRAVAVFDIENFMTGNRTGRGDIIVSGFVGLFVEQFINAGPNSELRGRISIMDFDASANNLTNNTSSFLRDVILVR